MTSSYRYPFPAYPNGWYLLATSTSLTQGAVLPLRYFGKDLVLFRTAEGRAVLVDAHCPHMGAHLGYGGVVEGEGIRCPFHSWRFGADGRCDDIPYSRLGRPPRVGVGAWTIEEAGGLIFVHYDQAGRPPTWRPPARAEWGSDGWVGYEVTEWPMHMHTQELAENVPDTAHFMYVHSLPGQPSAEDVFTDGHVYHQRTVYRAPDFEVSFTQDAYGLGLIWLHGLGNNDLEYYYLTAITPIDEESSVLRLLFLVNEGPGATRLSPDGRALVDFAVENTSRDKPIWNHKVYRSRPPLIPGDGPIRVVRKWAQQFYDDETVFADDLVPSDAGI